MTGPVNESEEPASLRPDGQNPPVGRPPDYAGSDGFRLTGEPPRVMRLSRKALAGIGVVASFTIGGSLIYALQPKTEAPPENLYQSESRNRPDQVTGAPQDYGSVPKLGSPLPGDLGGPILAARREGENVPVPPLGAIPATPTPPPDPRLAAEQQAAQEKDSARTSRLFLGSSGTGGEHISSPSAPPTADTGPDAKPEPSGKRAFLKPRGPAATLSAERIEAAAHPNILQAGSIISAALITGIRSDLPGQITAQVTQNVYDSPTGRILLIPQGSRLIGEYDSQILAGQNRVLLAWDRLILPGGKSILLDRFPGADTSGMSGLNDRTDYHWGNLVKASLISTLLGFGTELVSGDQSDLVRALRTGAQDTLSQTGRQIVERELGVAPTLTIRPGFALRIIVTRDLIFEPSGRAQ